MSEKWFEEDRGYLPEDPETLAVLGPKGTQAQMRYKGTSPAYYRLGRKIVYRGRDLNAWVEARRHNDLAHANQK